MPFLMPTIAKSFFPGGGTKGAAENAMAGDASGGGSSAGGGDLGQEYLDWLGLGGGEGIEGSDASKKKADGLDTRPSYGSDGMMVIENTTTYIQPIEV